MQTFTDILRHRYLLENMKARTRKVALSRKAATLAKGPDGVPCLNGEFCRVLSMSFFAS